MRSLIADKFNGIDGRFADAIGRPRPNVSGLLSGSRPIGEKIARDIESRLNLPPGWLDQDHSGGGIPDPVAPVLTPRQTAMLGLFDGLAPSQQEEVMRELEETQRRNAELYEALKKKLG